MRTDIFVKKIEAMGLKVYRGNNTITVKAGEDVIARVAVDKWARYQIDSTHLESVGFIPRLADLLTAYSATPVDDREEAYYRLWIPALSGEKKMYIHGTSSDSAVVAFTHDVNRADKVNEKGAKDVIILMDRVHDIEVKKERV